MPYCKLHFRVSHSLIFTFDEPGFAGATATVCGNIAANYDYPGNDIKPISNITSAQSCCDSCASTPSCNAYSWIRATHVCWVKTISANIQPTSNTNVDSGTFNFTGTIGTTGTTGVGTTGVATTGFSTTGVIPQTVVVESKGSLLCLPAFWSLFLLFCSPHHHNSLITTHALSLHSLLFLTFPISFQANALTSWLLAATVTLNAALVDTSPVLAVAVCALLQEDVQLLMLRALTQCAGTDFTEWLDARP